MIIKIKFISIILILIFVSSYSFDKIKTHYKEIVEPTDFTYLPNESAIQLVSLGYKVPTANFIWFHTLNYFGKHFRSDQKYGYLNHMCKIVTKLNPLEDWTYEFCTLILSYEAKEPENAMNIINFGIKNNPEYWRYYYLKGMLYMIFYKDARQAQATFALGAKCKDAPPFLIAMAARVLADFEKPDMVIEFLNSAIENASDESQRKALIERRSIIIDSSNMAFLQRLVDEYKNKNGKLPDSLNLFSKNLNTPLGGVYYLDKETGIVKSSARNTGVRNESY